MKVVLFGELSTGTLGISASGADQFETDTYQNGTYYGAFMYFFLRALRSESRFVRGPKPVTMDTAVEAAAAELRAAGINQDPVIAGGDRSFSLSGPVDSRKGKIIALLVGVNDYPEAGGDLRGCTNDVNGLHRLLVERSAVDPTGIRPVLDQNATSTRIRSEINTARGKLTENDVFIFLFSGHMGWSPAPDVRLRYKEIYPYDMQNPIKIADLVKDIGEIRCKQKVIILD